MALSNIKSSLIRCLSKKNKFQYFRGYSYSYTKINEIFRSDLSSSIFKLKNNYIPPTLASVSQKNMCSFEYETTDEFSFIARQIKRMKTITEDDIDSIRTGVITISRNVSDINFNAIFLEVCRAENCFSLGKEFFRILHSKNRDNIAATGKFFRLCYDFKSNCTEDDKNFLIKLYHDLRAKHTILDFRTCENAILGLSITNEWEEGLKILEMTNFTSSSPSVKMYSTLIECSFLNKKPEIAQKLLQEMVLNGKNPTLEVYKAWMESSGYSLATYYDMLRFIESYCLQINEETGDFMRTAFTKVKSPIKYSNVTQIHHTGVCKSCNRALRNMEMTNEEFMTLRDTFLDPVLIGKDIFLKTKPDELKSFHSYLNKVKKVDVVLDGLNIAYITADNRRKFNSLAASQILRQVVQHFVRLSKKVAVIGRKHMAYWPQNNMKYVHQNSFLFLADNVSADDPFILYTAMYSGLGTCFVSRDQMRSHKFLLKGSDLDKIFNRWQQKHQYYLQHVSPDGDVRFVEPSPYLRCAQESEPGVWHLPLATTLEGVPAHLIANRTKWLCLE